VTRNFQSTKNVSVDTARLSQILFNFLSNAAKYNKIDGQIKVGTQDMPDGHVRIYVKDTGIGIPSAVQKHVLVLLSEAITTPLTSRVLALGYQSVNH